MADLIEKSPILSKLTMCINQSEGDWDDGYNTGIAEAMQYVKNAPAVNRWIPCSKRLPEQTGYYLVCDSTAEFDNIRGRQEVAKFVIGRHGGHWYGAIRRECITHWMPLPEPPKGEQK